MHVRDAVEADAPDFRWIARGSLEAAYGEAVSSEAIDTAVEQWYSESGVADRLEDPTTRLLVAEADGHLLGFAEFSVSESAAEGTIHWVHVDPERWGEGVGDTLLEAVEAELLDRGVSRIEGTALTANEDVIAFFEEYGYVEGITRETEIGEETFSERSFIKFTDEDRPHLIETRKTETGTVYVALDEHKVGSKGDFYVCYRTEDRSARYGYFCDNCGSVNTAMDSMGRVQCNECDNTAKPTRWDAAYL